MTHINVQSPWVILSDFGSAFAMGAVGGTIWHGIKGFRNSPYGERRIGAITAVKMRAPVLGGNFGVWGGLFSTFDCAVKGIRKKEDPYNAIIAGFFTGGSLAIRGGYKAARNGAIGCAVLLAVIDKGHPGQEPQVPGGSFAGLIGLLGTSTASLSTEIGPVMAFPAYQRTHVTSHAVGLLLRYCFAERGSGGSGLGLLRAYWTCSSANEGSFRVAERMGFERVGVIPYHTRYPRGRVWGKVGNGKALPPGSDPDDLWRDTILLSLSWDVWQERAQEKVDRAMRR